MTYPNTLSAEERIAELERRIAKVIMKDAMADLTKRVEALEAANRERIKELKKMVDATSFNVEEEYLKAVAEQFARDEQKC